MVLIAVEKTATAECSLNIFPFMAGFFVKPGDFFRASSSSRTHLCNSHCLVLALTLLYFSLAVLAYALQWRGDFIGVAEFLPEDDERFPGMRLARPGSTVPLYSSPSAKFISRSLPRSLFSYGNWNLTYRQDLNPKICITVTTSAGLDQILPWIFFHKVIGVTAFYIFVEGTAALPDASQVLESIIGVNVIRRTRELEERQANSRIWNETWLERFFYKPCNHELFVKQTLNMETSIVMARDAGMDWIIHVDTDELIHPAGTSGYSIRELLSKVPRNIDVIVFPNYESLVEKDDVKEPFEEVSLFKKNYDHIPKDIFFENYEEASHGNPNFFLTYANGKAAARIQDHLRPNGAHRWHNYIKMPLEAKTEEVALLHYTYAKFSDLTSRRDRCACKPIQEVVRRCFILEFDRAAFMVASTGAEEEMRLWFNEHIVWNDTAQILRFLRTGIFARIYTPMVIVHGLKESGLFDAVITSAHSSVLNESSNTMLVNSSLVTNPENYALYDSNKDKSRGTRRV